MENNTLLRLHPKSYREVKGRLIFYLKPAIKQTGVVELLSELAQSKILMVTAYRNDEDSPWLYKLFVGRLCMHFSEGVSNNFNFYCSNVVSGERAAKPRKELFKNKFFTIIPGGGIFLIYNNELLPRPPEGGGNSWSMDERVYRDLTDRMEAYFDSDEDPDDEDQDRENRSKVSSNFRTNILNPFRDYTEKEKWAEDMKAAQGDGVPFQARSYNRPGERGPVYDFLSGQYDPDPEKALFQVGDRVSVLTEGGPISGVLTDTDTSSADNTVLTVTFYEQCSDEAVPKQGKLVPAPNNTQTNVRRRVISALSRGKVESRYMYQTFADFSTSGYEEPASDLNEFLAGKLETGEGKYPPNQMQLEAIIKGILTKDLLLVLGPPGTGKTTVIIQWVEYFVKQNKRVLISSQNNAAVDNVLARFKGNRDIVVRLGNENKVQDDCKEFLPQNKQDEMRRSFNENRSRVNAALARDQKELDRYRASLTQFRELYEESEQVKAARDGQLRACSGYITDLRATYQRAAEREKALEDLRESRARKELYLEMDARKNPLLRFFRRKYTRHVQAELLDTSVELRDLQDELNELARLYDRQAGALKKQLLTLRNSGLLERYQTAMDELQQFADLVLMAEGFVPRLESDLCEPLQEILAGHTFDSRFLTRCYQTAVAQLDRLETLDSTVEKLNFALDSWYEMVNSDRNDILQNILLETCQIVGATCIGINSNKAFANMKFDVSIVDESGQIQIHNALIPMSRARKNLMLGDYNQIPPCANEDVVRACREDQVDTKLLNMSFFEYLYKQLQAPALQQLMEDGMDRDAALREVECPTLRDHYPSGQKSYTPAQVGELVRLTVQDPRKLVNLNSQFRMPGNISDIISEWFYHNNYYSSYDMKRFTPMVPGTDRPLVVVSTSKVSDRGESQPSSGMGYLNVYEANLIAELVARVVQSLPLEEQAGFCGSIEHKIGIISAYGAQVATIRSSLQRKGLDITADQIRSMVASLDSFQGQERPLILYSLTRSTSCRRPKEDRVGFMKELRRLNVAFTRCQKQLVIVGDVDYLERCRNVKRQEDEGEEPRHCTDRDEEPWQVGQREIAQCADCPAVCERKFSRFMRLLHQHLDQGAGNLIPAAQFMGKGAS